jgi:hypothetical protein
LKPSVIITVCVILSLQLAWAQHPSRPCCTRLGDFYLNGKPILEADIVNKYGKGVFLTSIPESRVHIYFDPVQSLWIRFDASDHGHNGVFAVERIFVSIVPLARDTALSKSPFSPLVTENNICVGSKESQVIKLVGKPFRTDDAVEREARDSRYRDDPAYGSLWGSKVFVYFPEGKDSLLMFSIHLDNGIVRSLTLSCSE